MTSGRCFSPFFMVLFRPSLVSANLLVVFGDYEFEKRKFVENFVNSVLSASERLIVVHLVTKVTLTALQAS